MLQCLGAEEEKKLLWLFELRNFFLSFSSKFRAKNCLYIVQRRCRNSKSKRRGFLFNFCFLFLCLLFSVFLSHHQLERSLILVLWSLTKKFVKPPSLLFIIVKVGGPRSICFLKSGGASRVSVMTSLTTSDVFSYQG